ncbi:MAG: hypothetical protein LBB52_09735 [Desulfovibrio sp.]|jgi:hypothetical protein|nr:hypothetical protein [Desulfovibrio sp.]
MILAPAGKKTRLDELLVRLCALSGLAAPEADASGAYVLALPDGLTLRLRETRAGMELSGVVRPLPPLSGGADEADALCRELLALSLGRARKECAVSFPRLAVRNGEILLEDGLPADSSLLEGEKAVERFLNLLEKWTQLAAPKGTRRHYPPGSLEARRLAAPRGIILP